MIPQGKRDLGASGIQGARHAVQGRPGPPPSHPEAERHLVTNWAAYDTVLCRRQPGLTDRWWHLARPGWRERRDVRSWARRGAIRARRRRDVGPGGRWHRDVRTIRWSRVVRAWSGRLLCFRWRRGLLNGPVRPTSAGAAGRRPGCPAAGSPAWCPGPGSAPAHGCSDPPRPADGSRRPMVRRNRGAPRGRLRMTGSRPRSDPPEPVPPEAGRAAPAAARGRAALTPPRSPRGHRPPAGRRGRPPARPCAGDRSAQASLRDTP
jgi:hypothetical protein